MENLLLDRAVSDDIADWPIFSYSQASQWDRCEKAWFWGYAENWVKPLKSRSSNKGTMIHEMMDMYYANPVLGEGLVDEYMTNKINESMDDGQKDLKAIASACLVVKRYINEWAKKEDIGHRTLATEYHFTIPLKTGKGRNFILQGYIDHITEFKKKLWLWDHKSSESAQFWTPTEVIMDPQTPVYAAALRLLDMPAHGIIINQFNTYDYAKPTEQPVEKLFRRESCYRTDKELDSVMREFKFLVDDMMENNVTPRRSLRRDCKNCQFNEPCLMEMKGIDPHPFLVSQFVQKEKREVELKLTPARLV